MPLLLKLFIILLFSGFNFYACHAIVNQRYSGPKIVRLLLLSGGLLGVWAIVQRLISRDLTVFFVLGFSLMLLALLGTSRLFIPPPASHSTAGSPVSSLTRMQKWNNWFLAYLAPLAISALEASGFLKNNF